MEPEFYFYYLKCNNCGEKEMVPGPRKKEVSWDQFSDMLRRSPESRAQYKHCEYCQKITYTTLIAYDAE